MVLALLNPRPLRLVTADFRTTLSWAGLACGLASSMPSSPISISYRGAAILKIDPLLEPRLFYADLKYISAGLVPLEIDIHAALQIIMVQVSPPYACTVYAEDN